MPSRPRTVALVVLMLASALATIQPAAQQTAAQTGSLRIYLARHGQTDGNLNRRVQGWTDTPLNATGREQAQALARAIGGVQFDAIYSSTLSRSRETAQTVAGSRTVIGVPGLRELNFGKYEDTAFDDPILKTRPRDGKNPEDGESGQQFYERVSAAVKEIRGQRAAGTILIVAHAGTNQQVLRTLLDLTAQQASSISQNNDELYMINLDPGSKPRVWKFIADGKLNEL